LVNLDGFSAYLRGNEMAEGTRRLYLRILQDYSAYNGGSEPDRQAVRRWKAHLLEINKPVTVNLKLAALAKYCKFAGLRVEIRRVTVQRRSTVSNVITGEEIGKLLRGLEQDGRGRFAVIVRLMAKTGGRISEVVRCTKGDLMRGWVDMATKGKVRRIYFPAGLAAELEPYTAQLRPEEPLCRNRFGQPVTANGVAKMLRRYAVRYGIDPEHAHPHAFRHYFAIEFLRRNPNISLLADLLGHSGVNTTMIYLRMTAEQQKAEIDRTVTW
jgi:integrase